MSRSAAPASSQQTELPRLGGFHKATAATLPLAWRTGVCVLRELFVNP